jgi:hypothetical protein
VLGKHTLKPGEKTELIVTFATINSPGPFEKIVTIDIDSPEKRQYEVIMTGNVKEAPGAKIAMTSRKVEFGIFKHGETKKQNISVKNIGDRPLMINSTIIKSGTSLTVVAKTLPITIAAGQTAEVEIAITAGTPGAFTERVLIESNAKNAPKTGFVIQVTGKAE